MVLYAMKKYVAYDYPNGIVKKWLEGTLDEIEETYTEYN